MLLCASLHLKLIHFSLSLLPLPYSLIYLDRYVKSALPGIHNDEWQPLMSYRSSLTQHSEFDLQPNRAPGRQYRGRKRGRDDEEEDADQEEAGSEYGSEVTEN